MQGYIAMPVNGARPFRAQLAHDWRRTGDKKMTTAIHPTVDRGITRGAEGFTGGALQCQCAKDKDKDKVKITAPVAFNHACATVAATGLGQPRFLGFCVVGDRARNATFQNGRHPSDPACQGPGTLRWPEPSTDAPHRHPRRQSQGSLQVGVTAGAQPFGTNLSRNP
jgi:hypothetical protein